MFRRKPRLPDPYKTWIEDLEAEQRAAGNRWYAFDPRASAAGRRILAASPAEQRGFVLAAMRWLDHRVRRKRSPYNEVWAVRQAMIAVLRRKLPLAHDDVLQLLEWSARQPYSFLSGTPQTIKALQDYLKDHELTPALRKGVGRLAEVLESGYTTEETRRWAARLKELGGLASRAIPIVAGEAWSDSAIEEIEAMSEEARMSWVRLLNLCARASGAKPTARWS